MKLSRLVVASFFFITAEAHRLNEPRDDSTSEIEDDSGRHLWWNPLRDVVFIMDGSGSMDPSDWNMQKNGLVKVIQDSAVVPRDGSVSITVVQYAGAGEVEEVETTLVTSEAVADYIADQVSKIKKLNGLTHPGDGVRAATKAIADHARRKARQIFCLTTDAPGEDGDVALSDALKEAKRSSWKLDSFSVVAIGDSGYPDQDFEDTYRPLLIDGYLIVAKETATKSAEQFFIEFVRQGCFDVNEESPYHALSATIREPTANSVFGPNDMIRLIPTISQPFSAIVWTLDDKFIASTKRAWLDTSKFTPRNNPFILRVAATSLDGKTLAKSTPMSIYIKPKEVPVHFKPLSKVSIIKPKNGKVVEYHMKFALRAKVTPDDIPVVVKWYYDDDAEITVGADANVMASALGFGKHEIYAVATDSEGVWKKSDSVDVTVVQTGGQNKQDIFGGHK